MSFSLFPLVWRELRHGGRYISAFLICLVLGISVMTAIGTLGAATKQALDREADAVLGGHMEITPPSTQAATPAQQEVMEQFGSVSHVTELRAVAHLQDDRQLVELKAVDAAYPLIGEVWLDDKPAKPAATLSEDEVAVDASLLERLNLHKGDRFSIADVPFTIAAILTRDPNRMVNVHHFGPRVMLTHAALARAQVTQGNLFVRHHYKLRLNRDSTTEAVKQALQHAFPDTHWTFRTSADGIVAVEYFIEQLALLLIISGLSVTLIGGIGIGSAMHSFITSRYKAIAIMKTLGARRRDIMCIYALVIFLLTTTGCATGIAVALAVSAQFAPITGHWQAPAALACWYGFLIAYLFSLPALAMAMATRPALLFHRMTQSFSPLPHWRSLPIRTAILLIVLLIATLYATGRDPAFIAGFIAVNLLAFAVFGLSAYGIRQLAKRWRMRAPTLRLAMGNLSRPGSPTGTFILACGMSLMVLTASLLAEFNFQHRLDTVANTEAPSLFMIDVQPYQERGFIERITPLLGGNGYLRMHPYLQGRITKINGIPAKDVAVSEGLRRMLRGELGFSFSSTLPDGARFTAGKWWNADYHGPLLASVDDRFLPGMGLSIGDTITLDISGQEVEATIASARDIDYSTFHVNFTIVLSPGIISQFPRTAIAAVYLAPPYTAKPQVIETVKAHFPNVTLIQIDEAIRRTKEVFASIIRALRFTVLASLIAGALALVGALHTTLGHRHHETGVLKVLGVRKSAILKTYMAEWVIALLFTAPIAILIGVLGGWLIMQRIHHAFFYLRPDWLAMVAIGTCVFVGIISYLGNRKVVGTPLSTLLKPF